MDVDEPWWNTQTHTHKCLQKRDFLPQYYRTGLGGSRFPLGSPREGARVVDEEQNINDHVLPPATCRCHDVLRLELGLRLVRRTDRRSIGISILFMVPAQSAALRVLRIH